MRAEDYIAIRIKEICDERGITKYRLAKMTGLSQTALRGIFSKESIPTIPTLEKICDAFGMSIAQFFTKGEERPDLTELQKEMLEVWDQLDNKEREILITFVRSLKKR